MGLEVKGAENLKLIQQVFHTYRFHVVVFGFISISFFNILSMFCPKFLCLFYFENVPYFIFSSVTLLILVSLYDLKKLIVRIAEISYAPHPVSPIPNILQ